MRRGANISEIGDVVKVSGSAFDDNQAIGGSGNTGSGPVVHAGAGFGAGIFSGFGGSQAAFGPDTLSISNSVLENNTAQGGNDNRGTASVASLVGAGVGGGLGELPRRYGNRQQQQQRLDENQASGGPTQCSRRHRDGLRRSWRRWCHLRTVWETYDSSGRGPLGLSVVTVSGGLIDHNLALGGGAGKGKGLLGGANGEGGGIADLLGHDRIRHRPGPEPGGGGGRGRFSAAEFSTMSARAWRWCRRR